MSGRKWYVLLDTIGYPIGVGNGGPFSLCFMMDGRDPKEVIESVSVIEEEKVTANPQEFTLLNVGNGQWKQMKGWEFPVFTIVKVAPVSQPLVLEDIRLTNIRGES